MVAGGNPLGGSQEAEVGVNHYYDPHRSAGEEVSSTFEGRHVYVQEVVLIHADNGDGLVDKGQPVAFWEGVGIALKSAGSTSENIPIDTEGIWRVEVVATAAIAIGQSLYITTSGVVTDDPTDAQAVFGYTLQTISEAGTETIAVKVHWMSLNWLWLFWWLLYQFN
jgi:predicted RecA/RadA family phage recombinase